MKIKIFLIISCAFIIVSAQCQVSNDSLRYRLPAKFEKPPAWKNIEGKKLRGSEFYCTNDSLINPGIITILKIIDTEKDFCKLFHACEWSMVHYREIFPFLVERLTRRSKIGLNPYTDLYITDRKEFNEHNPISTGGKPGIVINEDIFTVAGRASWILNEITGENFASVRKETSKEKLYNFREQWVDWIKNLKKY